MLLQCSDLTHTNEGILRAPQAGNNIEHGSILNVLFLFAILSLLVLASCNKITFISDQIVQKLKILSCHAKFEYGDRFATSLYCGVI